MWCNRGVRPSLVGPFGLARGGRRIHPRRSRRFRRGSRADPRTWQPPRRVPARGCSEAWLGR
eukprot:237420-Alexandrium_andersonii.AAC.1